MRDDQTVLTDGTEQTGSDGCVRNRLQFRRIQDVRTAVSASGTGIVRLLEVDTGIENNSLTNDEEFHQLVKRMFHPSGDITGSAEYKQYLAAVTLSDMRRHCEDKIHKGACR